MTEDPSAPSMTTREQPLGTHRHGEPDSAASGTASEGPAAMGPLERAAYRRFWRRSFSFRREVADPLAERDAGKQVPLEVGTAPDPASGFAALRKRAAEADDDEVDDFVRPAPGRGPEGVPVGAGEVVAGLLFARAFDLRPGLYASIGERAPVIVVDVGDETMLGRVAAVWSDILFDGTARLLDFGRHSPRRRTGVDALHLIVKEPPKGSSKTELDARAQSMLAFALPFVAISPLARTHLPAIIVSAATARVDLPPLDARTVLRTIRIVTGRPCRDRIAPQTMSRIALADVEIAVRFDRTPGQCLDELRRLADAKVSKAKSRDLTLSQLHGLGEAREWAAAAMADIAAWKRGEISWDAVASAVALDGPPGCGKTTFASVFAAEAGLNLIAATLARWQSSGEAHLGHLLRAMRKDFDAARAQAPSCLFIDEIDSFPERAGVTHSYRDYVVEVVNALLAEIDGIAGREGVVVIGASNDISRCDPALLRAGRLERIVRIGLPDVSELEKMFRVRLGEDLAGHDLGPIAELAAGMTGADVERAVKDARRAARNDGGRDLTMKDLRGALVEEDDRPEAARWRTCIHEAAHLLVDVVHFGADGVHATVGRMNGSFGMSRRTRGGPQEGTPAEYRKRLEMVLAGRVAEEMVLGSPSHGAGGAAGSDLQQATKLAAAMIGSFGLAGPTPLVYLGPARDAERFLEFDEVREAVDYILSEAARSCEALLRRNLDALEAATRRLADDGRLDGAEMSRLLEEAGTRPRSGDAVPRIRNQGSEP